MANEPVPRRADKPEKPTMPLAATILVGALAVLGAITLVGWAFGAIAGILKFLILVVVVVAAFSWLAGRRLDR